MRLAFNRIGRQSLNSPQEVPGRRLVMVGNMA